MTTTKLPSTELATHAPHHLSQPAQTSQSLLELIAKLVTTPGADIDKVERVLAMQERIITDQRKCAYAEAMARVQEQVPQIGKSTHVKIDGKVRNKYAKLEDIDEVVKPILSAEGFSLKYGSTSTDGKIHVVSLTISHRDGWSEKETITLPTDTMGAKSPAQAVGSTMSYARRTLLKMMLNIVERDEDDDGNGTARGPEGFVTADQVAELQDLISSTSSDKAKFLKWLRVETLEQIPARDYEAARKALEEKMQRAPR